MNESLKIFYDGACYLCSAEIDHYRKLNCKNLEFVNIADPHFSAEKEGLDPYEVQLEMHVKTSDGKLIKGVDSFIEIWKHLPRYQWLVPICDNKITKPFLRGGYFVFARMIRPYLPKKKVQCETGSCPVEKR
jgi:predicted DCC family thiol-disulfide oxidoreductase YuxK